MPGLGHADRGDQLAGDDAGQPALLLLLGAVAEEVGQADVVVQGDAQPGAGVRGAQELLAEHGVEPEVGHSPAAVLLRDLHAEKSLPAGRGEQLPGRDPGGTPLVDVGGDLLVDERTHRGPEGLVVVVVERAAHVASSVPAATATPTPCGRGHHPTGARHLPRRFDHPVHHAVEFVRIITGEQFRGRRDIAVEKGGGVTLCKTDSYGNSCRGTPRRRRDDGGGAAGERACGRTAGTTRTALSHRAYRPAPAPAAPALRPSRAGACRWSCWSPACSCRCWTSASSTSRSRRCSATSGRRPRRSSGWRRPTRWRWAWSSR